MAIIRVRVPRDNDWKPTDRLQLYVGSPGAADLASSTPAGGELVLEQSPWPDGGAARAGLGALPLGEGRLGNTPGGYGLGEGELGQGPLGINNPPRVVLEHEYFAAGDDKTETLPIGVKIRDEAGNTSTLLETVVQLADPPKGVHDLTFAGTGTGGELRLSWTASPDV